MGKMSESSVKLVCETQYRTCGSLQEKMFFKKAISNSLSFFVLQIPVRYGAEGLETLEKKIFCSCPGMKLVRRSSDEFVSCD